MESKRLLLLVSTATVMLVSSAIPASAQFGGWSDRSGYYDSRRTAYENGYREGTDEGRKDARSRDVFEYRDEGDWRDADKGYRREFGDRNRYRQTFRSGFEAGYADGYRQYGPNYGYGNDRYGNGRAVPRGYPSYPNRAPGGYGSPGGYGYPGNDRYGYGHNPAYSAGFRDGFEKGQEDARDRDSFDPLRHSWYRAGDRDYRREYGSREQYRDLYRQAFREGYDRGYREAGFRR
jgi:hypothetical protein